MSRNMQMLQYVIQYWKPTLQTVILTLSLCLINRVLVLSITGVYLIGYLTAVCVATTWLSFAILQNFLQLNKPICFTLNPEKNRNNPVIVATSSIQSLSKDIDQYFIEKWFIYISHDTTFNEESRHIVEEVLRKMISVQLSMDNEALMHAVFNLYLKHLKEFRRGLKRKSKYGGKITDLYRYSHMCSDSEKSRDYFIHQLTTNLANNFINWELSNSLPYRVLVAIFSRKVVTFLLNLLSSPEFLNYYILLACASESKQVELHLSNYNRVKLLNITCVDDSTPTSQAVEPDNAASVVEDVEPKTFSYTPTKDSPILVQNGQKQEKDEIDCSKIVPDMVNIAINTEKPLARPKTPPPPPLDFKSESVKIHEPKSKSSCKTWYDSYDLESVTLGQDILNMIGDCDRDVEPATDDVSPIMSAKILLDEVKHDFKQITSSMKPISEVTAHTLHNIKDFQESTVNNVVKPMSQATSTALHKIGGIHFQDEAAGMVEGILDFGRTKIRKGLRLTGLQDSDSVEATPVPPLHPSQPPLPAKSTVQKRNILKMAHVKSTHEKSDDVETTWINPLQEDSVEMKPDCDEKVLQNVPSILTHPHEEVSPDPEYEEAADLATSIAKLRSLLEQKSSESSLSTPAVSPMPPEDISNNLSNKILIGDVDEGDGVMPSFYKFCAKTATGVFNNTLNTIKTALPSNVIDRCDGNEKWLFVESGPDDSDLISRMDKMLSERKVFCTVDTAYEAIDSLETIDQGSKLSRSNIQFEDELDDFEVKLPLTKTLLDILCELLADCKDTPLSQEPVIKSVLLLFGNTIEKTVASRINDYVNYWCSNTKIPTESQYDTLTLSSDDFVEIFLSGIPDYARFLIGEAILKQAANLFLSSLQVQKINQDVVLQIIEIFCMKLIEGSKQLSPVSA